MYINFGGQADLFDLDDALVLAGFLFFFGLLKAELAVVHDAADGRFGLGGDFYKIKTLFSGDALCFCNGNNAELAAVFVDEPDFLITNFFVDLMVLFADMEHLPKSK